MNVNFGLLRPVDVAGQFQAGLEQGQAQRRTRSLAALLRDPKDARAFNALAGVDPIAAEQWRDRATDRGQAEFEASQADQFRSAAATYMGRNALMPSVGGLSNGGAAPAAGDASGGDAPMSEADAAFVRMVKIDPMRAMQMQGAMREQAMERLREADGAFAYAAQQLGTVTDEASYQAMLGAVEQRFAPVGIDVRSMVPPTYPGADGVRSLLMRALDARQQIAALDRRDRLEADIADDEADNARADRNIDSTIAAREARIGITASREARLAAGGSGGGGGRRGGRRGGRNRRNPPTAVNPRTGERLILRNGEWVAAD